jgi:hypothetical protein
MTDQAPVLGSVQLLVYEFAADASFEGQLGGALGRIESGGTLRVLEVLFIQRAADSGELVVIDVHGDGAGSLIAPVLDFRLDATARRRATERALAAGASGLDPETIQSLGASLERGAAIAALLVEHAWAQALADAAERTSGSLLVNEFVRAHALSDVAPRLLEAAG